jgi:hypothetical protein
MLIFTELCVVMGPKILKYSNNFFQIAVSNASYLCFGKK